MSRFKQGQVITLKSDKGITGAIVNIIEGYPETRYQVFTATGMQTYYESQIDIQKSDEEMEKVDAERFNAGLVIPLQQQLDEQKKILSIEQEGKTFAGSGLL